MKRHIALLWRTLFLALLLPMMLITPASANSAQTHWSGVDSAGAIVRQEHSPVVVEKEVLTFDIQEFPENHYSDLDSYLAYSGKVTAEYTFYNPALCTKD